MQDKLPPISLALVEALERRFPNRLPTRHELGKLNNGELLFESGQCDVVRFLREEHQRQENADLED